MADTDWNLHSKQLITPTDNDRMLVEPSDETAKAVEVGGFRNWLMSTALFNTLTTTAKTIIGAIEEIKGKVEDNTTSLNDLANPSILINGDFRNPINQRGKNKYNTDGSGWIYTIDRFIGVSSGGGESNGITINDGYISLFGKLGSQHSQMAYLIEFPSQYRGKTITLSMKYRISKGKNNYNFRIYSQVQNTTDKSKEFIFNDTLNTDGQWHIYTKTYKVPDSNFDKFIPFWLSCINFNFETLEINKALDEDCQIDVEWVKDELGAVATPFVPRPYGEELALCKRYYRNHDMDLALSNFYGYAHSTDGLSITMNFDTPMRVTPTFTLKDNNIRCNSNGEVITLSSFSKHISPYGLGTIYLIQANKSLVVGQMYSLAGTFDSEIY